MRILKLVLVLAIILTIISIGIFLNSSTKTEYFNAREYEKGYFLILNFNYEEGVKLIQEGVDRQSSDGGWMEGKNHRDYSATAFFSLAVASSYLTIKNRNLSAEYKQNLNSWESSLKRSNKFLMNERYWNIPPQRIYRVPILKEGVVPGYPFHNQIAGAALAAHLTYLVTNDTKYLQDSEKLVEFLLKHQSPEGWYPEMGGPDCSYNAVSCFLLQQLYFQSNNPRLFESIEKSLKWETTKILDDGTIDTSGNSRITKNPDARIVVLAFWNWRNYSPGYGELSQKIAERYNLDITILEKISFLQNP